MPIDPGDLALVRLDDLKEAVKAGNAELRGDITALQASITTLRTENQAAVDRYAASHDKIHSALEDSLKARDQRFWAAVGILTTIIVAVGAVLIDYALSVPITGASAVFMGGFALLAGSIVLLHAKLAALWVGFAGFVGGSRPGRWVIDRYLRWKTKP